MIEAINLQYNKQQSMIDTNTNMYLNGILDSARILQPDTTSLNRGKLLPLA